MPTITDRFGIWNQLGSVTLQEYNQWFAIGEEHIVTTGSYRVSFSSNNFSRVRSFGWLRAIYNSGSELIVSPAIRIYPKNTPTWIEFPLPKNLVDAGIQSQRIEFKKVIRRWRSDWMWSVFVDELLLESKRSQNTFFLVLDNPSYSRDPENSNLWVTTFRENLAYASYEVGRFYDVETDQLVGDPFIDPQPNELIAVFVNAQPIAAGAIKVRIIV